MRRCMKAQKGRGEIFQRILKENGVRMWSGFIWWRRIEWNWRMLWRRRRNCWFCESWRICRLTERCVSQSFYDCAQLRSNHTHTHTHKIYIYIYIRGWVQKFPALHTKAAPNGKYCEGYIAPSMVRFNVSACVEIKGDYIEIWLSYFISVTLKSWSGRKILDPPTYMLVLLLSFYPNGIM